MQCKWPLAFEHFALGRECGWCGSRFCSAACRDLHQPVCLGRLGGRGRVGGDDVQPLALPAGLPVLLAEVARDLLSSFDGVSTREELTAAVSATLVRLGEVDVSTGGQIAVDAGRRSDLVLEALCLHGVLRCSAPDGFEFVPGWVEGRGAELLEADDDLRWYRRYCDVSVARRDQAPGAGFPRLDVLDE